MNYFWVYDTALQRCPLIALLFWPPPDRSDLSCWPSTLTFPTAKEKTQCADGEFSCGGNDLEIGCIKDELVCNKVWSTAYEWDNGTNWDNYISPILFNSVLCYVNLRLPTGRMWNDFHFYVLRTVVYVIFRHAILTPSISHSCWHHQPVPFLCQITAFWLFLLCVKSCLFITCLATDLWHPLGWRLRKRRRWASTV